MKLCIFRQIAGNMKRKEFLKRSDPAFLLLANGDILKAGDHLESFLKKKKSIRFAIASDIHYGEPKTDYAALLKTGLERINEAHTKRPFDFCMLNGDIVHNDPQCYPAVKKDLEQLQPKYYVTVGNHDRVSPAEWDPI